jgi:hypothetical protein
VGIQEYIQGVDGKKALEGGKGPFAHGGVDDPQKELGRIAGCGLGFHAIDRGGKVHGDIKAENMMTFLV